MGSKIYGIDVDGCLADFNRQFVIKCQGVTGRNLFGEDFVPRVWDFPEALGYTAAEVTAVWEAIKTDPKFWQNLPPYTTTPSDIAALVWEQANGNDVYFITNRMGVNARQQTVRFLQSFGFPEPTVLLTPHKGLAIQTLGITDYIDDRWENVMQASATSARSFMMDRPWNQHDPKNGLLSDDPMAPFIRVTSVVQMIGQLSTNFTSGLK